MNWSNFIPWASQRVQEVIWDIDPNVSNNLDTVLVNGKKVLCAPGLRFADSLAVKMGIKSGWILSFAKLEDLDQTNVYLDWIEKSAMEPKLKFFANCLLKLQESRTGEKVSLNEEQRKEFADKLIQDLICVTGQDPDEFLRNGFSS